MARRFRLERLFQSWPLFDVRKVIHNSSVYAVVDYVVAVHDRADGLRHLLNEIRRLERACWHDGLAGWLCGIERTNGLLLRWVKALGAEFYAEDATDVFVVQYVTSEPPAHPPGVSDLARRVTKEAHA